MPTTGTNRIVGQRKLARATLALLLLLGVMVAVMAFVMTAVVSTVAAAQASTFDFEAPPGVYTTQFQSRGFTFPNGVEIYQCNSQTCISARSGTRVGHGEFAGEFAREPVTVRFNSLQSTVWLWVRADEQFPTPRAYEATIRAYADDNPSSFPIDTRRITFQSTSDWQQLMVATSDGEPRIRRVVVTGGTEGTNSNFIAVDDLSFEALPSASPSPPSPPATSLPPDTEPVVTVLEPEQGETLTRRSVDVVIHVEDDRDLITVTGEVTAGNGTVVAQADFCGSTFSGACPVSPPSPVVFEREQTISLADALRNGTYTLRVTACDGASHCTVATRSFVLAIGPEIDMRFRNEGPHIRWSGRAVAVAVNPQDLSIGFVASESGGLFKTTDKGETWTLVKSLPVFRLADVRISPQDPRRVIVTATSDFRAEPGSGIWRSADGGDTWREAPALCRDPSNAWGVAFSPDNADVYVGTNCGLAISRNSGFDWRIVDVNFGTDDSVSSVVVGRNGLIDVCGKAGHFRSTSFGFTGTWTDPDASASAAQKGPRCTGPENHALAISPFDSNVLFGATIGADNRKTLLQSVDGGATWEDANPPDKERRGRPPFVTAHLSPIGDLGYDVYFGNGIDTFHQFCRQNVGGETACSSVTTDWTKVDVTHVDPSDIAYEGPGAVCPLYITTDGGLHKTTNCGNKFPIVPAKSGYNALQLYEVDGQIYRGPLSSHTDLYVGTHDNDLWASPNRGRTWGNSVCCEFGAFQIKRIAWKHKRQKVVGEAIGGAKVFISNPHLRRVKAWNHPPGWQVGYPRLAGGKVFVQWGDLPDGNDTDATLWLTEDRGRTWKTSLSVPANPSGASLTVVGPVANPIIYVPVDRSDGTIGLLRIEGIRGSNPTIENADQGLGSIGMYAMGQGTFGLPRQVWPDPDNPRRLIAADIGNGTIQVSRNGGDSWTPDAELTSLVTDDGRFLFAAAGFANCCTRLATIAYSPDSEQIFAGTEMGVLVSLNDGISWSRVPDSRSMPAVTSFFFGKDSRSIWASSYGRGLWVGRKAVEVRRPPR